MIEIRSLATALIIATWALAADSATAQSRTLAARDSDVPLIKAEPGPVKVKPDDPGGLKVPHGDKTIYERIQSRQKDGQRTEKYRIQIGSFADTQAAESRWQGLRRSHREVLGSLKMHIEKVTLERGRKTIYRLQAGPLDSPAEVKKVCLALAERKVGCTLVKG